MLVQSLYLLLAQLIRQFNIFGDLNQLSHISGAGKSIFLRFAGGIHAVRQLCVQGDRCVLNTERSSSKSLVTSLRKHFVSPLQRPDV